MHHKASSFFSLVFVLSAMLFLSLGYVQAQITGFIPVFVDEFGTEDTSVIFQTPTGNVGIGTTNPTQKLDVRGNLTLDVGEAGDGPVLYTATGSTELNRYLQLINSPGFPSGSGLKASGILVGDDHRFANPGKNDLVVKGNVGIGTASPASKLHVVGRVLATGYDMPSDIRLKEDVTPLTGVLAKPRLGITAARTLYMVGLASTPGRSRSGRTAGRRPPISWNVILGCEKRTLRRRAEIQIHKL